MSKDKTLTILNFWRRANWTKVENIEARQTPKTKPCKVYDFCEYRNSFTKDQLWVKHYLWWSGMIFEAKRRRRAKDRSRINQRNIPRR